MNYHPEYHPACAKANARIAELEAEKHELTLRLNDQRTTAAALRKVASEAEAALAERELMLRLAQDHPYFPTMTPDEWLAGLKARAEERSKDE